MGINEWLIKKQHNKYLDELYQDQYNYFFNVANMILNNKNDAEDAVSESFVNISKNIKKIFQLSCHEKLPYCVKIVKNCSYNILRSQKKIVKSEYLIDNQQTDEKDIFEEISEKFRREEVIKLLDKLSDLELLIIKKRYYENKSFRTIGEIFDIKEATARQRHQRIIEKLKAIYEEGVDNG